MVRETGVQSQVESYYGRQLYFIYKFQDGNSVVTLYSYFLKRHLSWYNSWQSRLEDFSSTFIGVFLSSSLEQN